MAAAKEMSGDVAVAAVSLETFDSIFHIKGILKWH